MKPVREDTKPWYRQFWPWFIISIPGGTVIAAFITIYIATKGADTLVKDDYYKEGLAINVDKGRQQRAVELNIATRINVSGNSVELQFAPAAIAPERLQLALTHPTMASLDQRILLVKQVDGIFRGPYTPLQDNINWLVSLTPENNEWSVQTRWSPSVQNQWVELRPDL